MRKSILTASKEWTPAYARVTKARGGVNKLRSEAFATDEHGKSEPEALATVSKEEAFATDEHGITRK